MPKRRLEDLFVQGRFETIDDGRGDPIVVWLQKLSPTETSSAIRRANAAKARVMALRHQPTPCPACGRGDMSEEYEDIWATVQGYQEKENLIAYLIAEDQMRIETKVEEELAAEEEWATDGYLQGLRDSWQEGQVDYVADPESPEGQAAKRVLEELERFGSIAAERGAPELAVARAELEAQPLEALQRQIFDRQVRYRASAAWSEEFHRCELFYGVHPAVPDAKEKERLVALPERYFDKRDQVDKLQSPVLQQLYDAFADLTVDITEGKDSEETPNSSGSSEPQSGLATEVSSGPVAVAP